MTQTREYPQGVPCWIDLEVADREQAERFYGALFGWEFANAMPPGAPGFYDIATLDGADAAAVGPGGGSPRWTSYIACDDADATAEAVARAGGAVLVAPEDAGPGGRSATCADPQGAVFRLWQARRRRGAQAVNAPGAWNFSDLHTPDPAASLAFYGAVFGWEQDAGLGAGMIRLTGYGDHLAATIDPEIFARQASAPPGFADVVAALTEDPGPARWSIRFGVADRDESIRAVEEGGGRLLSMADTEWTREAGVADPAGAEFVLSQFAPRG
jgi:uncharacterized protein